MVFDSLRESTRVQKVVTYVQYIGDYLIIGAVEVVVQVIGDRLPAKQSFSILDPTLSYPMATKEQVPSPLLYVASPGVPALLVLLIIMIFGPGNITRRLRFLNAALLGIGTAVVFTQLFTELIKTIIGRPRPDFLSRCQPDLARAQANITANAVQFFDVSICTSTNLKVLNDGFRSFPSGHASQSFAGLTFLSFYLSGRLHLFAPHSPHGKHLYGYVFSVGPLLLASYIASTRVSDFRHRLSDVAFGALLGVIIAIITYRYYYPPLRSSSSNIPWAVLREEDSLDDIQSSHDGHLLPRMMPKDGTTPYSDRGNVLAGSGSVMELHSVPQIRYTEPSTSRG